jgi:beta-galactosidase
MCKKSLRHFYIRTIGKVFAFVLVFSGISNAINAKIPPKLFIREDLGSQQVLMSQDKQKTISLNGTWSFKYYDSLSVGDDSLFFRPEFDVNSWKSVRVPGSWELQGFAAPCYGLNLKAGTGLYCTEFDCPSDWKRQSVQLAFDGVQYGFDVWINGWHVGFYSSSFNRRIFDVSKYMLFGQKNRLALRVTTRPKGWEFDVNDCWALSGIDRDVTLFCLPQAHLKDVKVTTRLEENEAKLFITAKVNTGGVQAQRLSVQAVLTDPQGQLVDTFLLKGFMNGSDDHEKLGFVAKSVFNPSLWTAETPSLYTLEIDLLQDGQVIHTHKERLGLREVSWDNGILKLNGKPIKLRGVNHHDLSPVNGRSVTESEIREDLVLIRKGNANFIRTSHYPPHPRLLALCDEMGFYVMDEVPFGFGEKHLNDTSYLPLLKERALATVMRDKDHASVIIWSVGNENPLTDICLQTGKYVKSLDYTRPFCYPQIGSYFKSIVHDFPDSVDLLCPHYPVPSTLREYAGRFNRPMIVTEYAHSLGLDFDRMEELWEIMYRCSTMAGGAVWHFFDQGIERKSVKPVQREEFTTSVWIDSMTELDNHGNEGGDGLVYANRVPQVDYWQMRKVYTPVKPLDDTLLVRPGWQMVKLGFINRYDFRNLSDVRFEWQLWSDNRLLRTGLIKLEGAPHDTIYSQIKLDIPSSDCFFPLLKLVMTDKDGYTFYEKTYPLRFESTAVGMEQRLKNALSVKTAIQKESSSQVIYFGKYSFQLSDSTGCLRLTDLSGATILSDGPYLRTGRKITMSEQANLSRAKTGESPVWIPNVQTQPTVRMIASGRNERRMDYTFERQDQKGQFFTGIIDYVVSDSGRIDVNYSFIPKNAKGNLLEGGLSFLVPENLTEFRWVGKGPYASYPGKDRLDEFGFYHLNSADLNYQGNRSEVEIALFTDANGKGFALIANGANVAVERSFKGLIVSHNALVSGRFNKFNWPESLFQMDQIKGLFGRFSIVPLDGNWPGKLKELFGSPNVVAVPYKPFYHSYDQ